jgi:AbrB family looped-hinge helix DNA binding protein
MTETRTRLGRGGRVVIPAEYRRALHIEEGDQVVLQIVDGEIRLTPLDEAIRRAQALIRKHVPADVSLVDELIAERRAEATRE